MFSNIYTGKKVMITGHTGFKGTWLCVWFLKLGADVVGVSKDIPTQPSMFEELNISQKNKEYRS
jgi:CDP-glucose 4,6-dehydratase